MANILLSLLLFHMLREDPVAAELFVVPNAWLGRPPSRSQLLRFKYSLPWVAPPSGMKGQAGLIRGAFLIARVAGAAFPCLMAGFLVGAFFG